MRKTLPMTEAQWQTTVIAIAKSYGWRVHHGRTVQTGGRYMTPIQGHKGFPDLVLAKGGRVILAELKQDGRYPEPEQRAWRDAIGQQWRLWRPKDRDAVVAELSGRVEVAA